MVDRAITLNSGLCVCAGSRKEEVVGCGGRTVPVIRSCVCVPVRSICVGLWIVRGERDPMCEILFAV